MKTPRHPRRLIGYVILGVAALWLAGSAFAQAPPHGRYRCYQPPGYTVMAWFDLDAKGISVNGAAPHVVRIDAAKGRIDLPRGLLPPHRYGYYFAPGAAGGDAERVTVVLAGRADLRPGQPAWEKQPRCYLTTH